MNSKVYIVTKPSGTGYNHVTFVVGCGDGFYEFGFYGLGKNNSQKKDVTIDKYQSIAYKKHFVGNSQKSLENLINHAKLYPNKKYNLASNNCGDFAKYMCGFAGVKYPFGSVIDWDQIKKNYSQFVDNYHSSMNDDYY
eukprot:TRINITY_DN4978_c0_g1_i1.p1 TRINITY_DN4978_c0_g1~~TRINITY_DN4978_c0_g1_i1.p1  ORF type:complete len:145 (-),score=32.25 TRINITY_DN4978_c0_g1_i1:119-532(-)